MQSAPMQSRSIIPAEIDNLQDTDVARLVNKGARDIAQRRAWSFSRFNLYPTAGAAFAATDPRQQSRRRSRRRLLLHILLRFESLLILCS